MQTSKQKINPVLERQLSKTFFQLVTDLQSVTDAEQVLKVVLTPSELEAVSKRLAIAYFLTKGRNYENIKQNLKVSSATVAGIQDQIKSPGWKLAIQKITADEWATLWEQRIKNVFKR
jgi:uncharacterized protein YerC